MWSCRQSMLIVVITSLVVSLQAKTPRHGHFEYNARKMGNRKITVLSIRRDPFRDRRSILEQTSGPFHKSLASEILEARLKEEKSRSRHGRRHGHGDYKRRKEEALKETILEAEREYLESINERTSESRSINILSDLSNRDILGPVGDAKIFPRYPNVFSNITENNMLKPKRSRSRRPRKKSGKKKRLRRKNNTENSRSRSRSRTRSKNKNERRKDRKKTRGKNSREGRRSCRGLKGAEKRECRKNRKKNQSSGSEKVDPQLSIIKQTVYPPSPVPMTVSGSEACQYHNLQFCAEQSNLLEKSPADLDLYTRCNLRMDFLLCMESQRDPAKTTPCSPDFKISGDMSYIRNRIREVVQSSSSSCLLP